MPKIVHSILIYAPIEVCFDLARDVEVHQEKTKHTKEKAIDGVTSGLMEKGDEVTWEAVHLGIRQKLTAKITDMHRPYEFTDVMVKGAFHSFTHKHQFIQDHKGTIMKDTFDYQSPLGVLGKVADQLFLKKYMETVIGTRARELKRIAEEK